MDYKDGDLLPTMQDARRDNAHLGVYLLLGQLLHAGRECDVLDWVAEFPGVSLGDVISAASQYQAVFFSCNSLNWAAVRVLALGIRRENPRVRICVGGPHPTMYPDVVAREGLFDAYFRGEADRSILSIYDALVYGITPHEQIPGLWMPSLEQYRQPGIVQEVNLHELDWHPAYDRVPRHKFLTLPVETSRGCKYHCTFCSIPGKNNWRAYPAATTVEQLYDALAHVDDSVYKKLSIIDNTFTANHGRVMEICNALQEEPFRRRLMYDATLTDLKDQELFAALEPFTSDLLVGAEVSTAADAKRIRKPAIPGMIEGAAANLQDLGMAERTVFSFIIGFPWQRIMDCLHTVHFAVNLILEYGVKVYLQWYWPMPGSDIWRALERENRVDISVIDTPGFFHLPSWFYGARRITPEDVSQVNRRVRPAQLCLALSQEDLTSGRRPLEYSPPYLHENEGQWEWETRRNPFLTRRA